jgi:hypothetical protein
MNLHYRLISNPSKLDSCVLTNIYGPCTTPGKGKFLEWFANISMPDVVGDFNLMHSSDNRNKPRVILKEIFSFNESLSNLRLVEIPLKEMKYTWSNMQSLDPPLNG